MTLWGLPIRLGVRTILMIGTPPPMRDSYHHGNLALALVDEAARMIEADGARDFSVRACAKALGVDVAAVYRHYASKDALLSAVAEHGSSELVRLIERMTARLAVKGPAEVFIAIGQAYVRFAIERPRLYEAVFASRARRVGCDPVARKAPARVARQQLEPPDRSTRSAWTMLVDCLDRMVDAGLIDPAAREGADLTAWAAVHGLAALLNRGSIQAKGSARDLIVERLCRTVLAGLRQQTAPSSRPTMATASPSR